MVFRSPETKLKTHLKTCEYLGKEPAGQFKKVHDFLTKLWDGMELVVNSQNDRISIQKEVGWVFEQDFKFGYMWYHSDRVWPFFREDMGMGVAETQDFIKSMVEEHLKCVVETPW